MSERRREKQVKMLSAITRINSSIGENLQLEEVCGLIAENLVNITGCSDCNILLIEGDKVRALAAQGFSKMPDKEKLKANAPLVRCMVDTGQDIYTGDVAKSPAADYLPAGCFVKSLICIPVVINDKVWSIIELDSPEENAFGEEDIGFAQLMAKEVSIALERSLLQSQVQLLTTKDSLTGCFNRRKFEEDLEVEVARAKRYHRPLSFLSIVVDWFKKYDDYHGHNKSSELLIRIADILRGNVRSVDKVYRYEGEEFIILLPETTEKNALHVARRIQKIIGQVYFAGELESQPHKKITLSIEIAGYPWDGECKEEMLKSIAFAMYRAKQSGRKRHRVLQKVKSVKKTIRSLM